MDWHRRRTLLVLWMGGNDSGALLARVLDRAIMFAIFTETRRLGSSPASHLLLAHLPCVYVAG
jgi:hypothetical protein